MLLITRQVEMYVTCAAVSTPPVKGKLSRKVLPQPKLPHHSVDAVWLDDDTKHQEGLHEPVAVVTRAHQREAMWGTLCNHHSAIWLPNHVLWLQLIELHNTPVIRSPHLVVCPGPL
jgi:hypothetical protein